LNEGSRFFSSMTATLLLSMPLAIGSFNLHATEYDIEGSGYHEPPAKLSLACRKNAVEIWFQWETAIGKSGRYRRHLFDSGEDVDVLVPSLPGGNASGFINRDKEAKALIAYLLPMSEDEGVFSAQVFPQGADPVNGAWIWRHFSVGAFHKAATAVAKECHWDLVSPKPSPLKVIPAGAPFPDE